MERCKAFLVYLVDVGSAFNELIHHNILPVVARHMEGSVAIRIGLIDLDTQDKTGTIYNAYYMSPSKETRILLAIQKTNNPKRG